MKKGFLFGGPSKTKTSSEKSTSAKTQQPAVQKQQGVEEIPLIRPKEGSGDSKEQYRMEEVQDALRVTAPLLQNKGIQPMTTPFVGAREGQTRFARGYQTVAVIFVFYFFQGCKFSGFPEIASKGIFSGFGKVYRRGKKKFKKKKNKCLVAVAGKI